MLFATYQEFFDIKNEPSENLLNPNRYYNKKLGFSPLWAFPVDDFSSFVAHSLCTAPNYSDMFYLIETDKYIRINKVLHYQIIARGEYLNCKKEDIDYSKVIDTTVDNDHSEFLLNPDDICSEDIKCFCPVIDVKENTFEQLRFMFPSITSDDNVLREIAAVMKNWVNDVPTPSIDAMKNAMLEQGFTEQYAEVEGRQRIFKFMFEMLMFPYIFQRYVSHSQVLRSQSLGMTTHNARKFWIASNNFAEWSYGSCDKEGYDRIFNETKNLVITNDAILNCIANKNKIYPNDPCPCGSGRKFKACHGKYY